MQQISVAFILVSNDIVLKDRRIGRIKIVLEGQRNFF
jgi:hypothetical protein